MNLRPVFYGLVGAARLIRLDQTGAHLMIGGRTGFWASLFWPMALLAPLYAFVSLLRFDPTRHESGWRYVIVHSEFYILAWLIMPLLMVSICQRLNRGGFYLGFIIGYNWLLCLTSLFQIILSLANASHMLPFDMAAALSFGFIIASTFWIILLARDQLQISWLTAAGIAVLDLGIAISLGYFRSFLLA